MSIARAIKFDFCKKDNVHLIPQDKLGWPYDTLMRFDMFLRVEEQLKQADYIFFFNSNAKFLRSISAAEILPDDAHDGLVAATFNWRREKFTYERSPKSLAYIPEGEGKHYFRGGVNGGKSDAYLKMVRLLDKNIKADLAENIVAEWHDESHINKYLSDKNPLVLSENYCFNGAKFVNPFKVKIVMQDKSSYKFGGKKFLRGEVDKPVSLLTIVYVKLLRAFCPLIPIKKLRKKLRDYYRDL